MELNEKDKIPTTQSNLDTVKDGDESLGWLWVHMGGVPTSNLGSS
jgi:hypothetical protein